MSPAFSAPASVIDVLLIDDSRTDLQVLMALLIARGLRVSVAFNGATGYQQAALQKPRLILLDVLMPVQDGFATCRLLKADPVTAAIPVIFLSAANDVEERLEGFFVGAVDYIGKPFNVSEVLARIGVHGPFTSSAPLTPGSPPASLEFDGGPDAVLVHGAQKALRQALASPPSLDELSALLGTNRRRLNQAFQSCCKISVFGWLREERMHHARHLVTSTNTPLALIGDHLGFATSAHFTKVFRDRFGSAPRSFRNRALP